jgi:hypothetical protein
LVLSFSLGTAFLAALLDATLEDLLARLMGVLAPLVLLVAATAATAATLCVVLLRRLEDLTETEDAGEAAREEDLEEGVRERSAAATGGPLASPAPAALALGVLGDLAGGMAFLWWDLCVAFAAATAV